ncbi:MAG: DUF4019 domain-containing protein [Erythrobacter sp.]
MPAPCDTLTDKEKQTLRLIVRGHDAKSAASELDISVHTVDERLRAARRKLNVTSSREAARLLLESEQNTPESRVYEPLGDAPPADPRNPSSTTQPGQHSGFGAVFWIGGIAIMLTFAIALVLATTGNPLASQIQAEPVSLATSEQDQEVEAAARKWLALVDKEDWEGSFAAAAKPFQEPNTVESWKSASALARTPLGAAITRKAVSFSIVAAPPSGYQVVRFSTDFANQKGVMENVTLVREDGELRVVGYFLS